MKYRVAEEACYWFRCGISVVLTLPTQLNSTHLHDSLGSVSCGILPPQCFPSSSSWDEKQEWAGLLTSFIVGLSTEHLLNYHRTLVEVHKINEETIEKTMADGQLNAACDSGAIIPQRR